jgi:hypothetical protein
MFETLSIISVTKDDFFVTSDYIGPQQQGQILFVPLGVHELTARLKLAHLDYAQGRFC